MRLPALLLALCVALPAIALDLAAPGRPAADAARDALDHPAAVLGFAGVTPGMQVADVFGGGGYWAELIARQAGPDGRVLLVNNRAYLGFGNVAATLETRLAGGRLANVQRQDREATDFGFAPGSLDGAVIFLTLHDFWLKEGDWDVEAAQVLPQLRAALKPGGFLLIADHRAREGSGIDDTPALHRIDEAWARAALEGFGFRFEKSSELLANPQDDRSRGVFDPAVRGRTDRFLHLYRNPG